VNNYCYQVEISERDVAAWHSVIDALDFAIDSGLLLYTYANQLQEGVLSACPPYMIHLIKAAQRGWHESDRVNHAEILREVTQTFRHMDTQFQWDCLPFGGYLYTFIEFYAPQHSG
jgi:hypothetical protein